MLRGRRRLLCQVRLRLLRRRLLLRLRLLLRVRWRRIRLGPPMIQPLIMVAGCWIRIL